VDAAAAHALGQPDAKPGTVGVIGYCMGGGLSLLMACRSDRVGAAAVYYGQPPQSIDEVGNIKAPVLGIFGAEDDWLMPEVPKLQEAMRRHNKSYDQQVYQGAPHAFFNDTQDSYRREASQDAWRRTLDFFKKNL
jgi:carboxymethylenebutenolidase